MAVRFIRPIPKGLTPKQKDVFLKMDRDGYHILTTEGANYKCWLEKKGASPIHIDRRTAISLYEKDVIKPDDSFDSNHLFKWILK